MSAILVPLLIFLSYNSSLTNNNSSPPMVKNCSTKSCRQDMLREHCSTASCNHTKCQNYCSTKNSVTCFTGNNCSYDENFKQLEMFNKCIQDWPKTLDQLRQENGTKMYPEDVCFQKRRFVLLYSVE